MALARKNEVDLQTDAALRNGNRDGGVAESNDQSSPDERALDRHSQWAERRTTSSTAFLPDNDKEMAKVPCKG